MTESKKTLTKNSDSNPYETALQEEKKDQAIKAQMIQRPSLFPVCTKSHGSSF